MTNATPYDVVIIGGGPGGSTAASLLRKYNPALRVLILEKARFPRDHVGESQLPAIGSILNEMGVWEKVEQAGFPIKIGASYTWGRNNDRWDFDFYPVEEWRDEPRPAMYTGQRLHTAFQVDRALYDDLLLKHAESLGAEARQETHVVEILREGDRVTGLRLECGEIVTGRHYIDASGTVGILRRAMGVEVRVTNELRNIAVWEYWRNAEWAVEIGVGATRVQVRSLPYGWIWFIPLGPDRTSVGLITPAEHYKKTGLSPEEIYLTALEEQPEIASLVRNATRENNLQSCKDWSQLAERVVGENWFLVGEAAGFADPILAAGMSLAHSSAREAAYTILELDRAELDPAWLRERYDRRNRTNIEQHIRFAQYWYSANGCFTDLQDHCANIAKEAGLKFKPGQAWRWLSQGGFTTEQLGLPTFGSFDVSTTKQILSRFEEDAGKAAGFHTSGYNVFKLNLRGATKGHIGQLENGRITMIECWQRGEQRLPLAGYYGVMVRVLEQTSDIAEIVKRLGAWVGRQFPDASDASRSLHLSYCIQSLEVMIEEYWVTRSVNKKRPMLTVSTENSRYIRSSEEARKVIEGGAAKGTIKLNI